MNGTVTEFRRGVIRPWQCFKAGWRLIKDQYWLFFGITVVGMIIGSAAPLAVLLGPMMCGIFIALLGRMRGDPMLFDQLFKGFDHFSESLIATLIEVGAMLVLMVPFGVVMFALIIGGALRSGGVAAGGPDFGYYGVVAAVLVGLLFLLVLMIINALFNFSFPLIVDRRLSGLDAVKTSIRGAWGNFGGVVGLLLLSMLFGVVGMLFCYVGALFVMPIIFAAWGVAYRQVFPA